MKSKWNILYIVLAAVILFSLFAVPKIAKGILADTKGKIVIVETEQR